MQQPTAVLCLSGRELFEGLIALKEEEYRSVNITCQEVLTVLLHPLLR